MSSPSTISSSSATSSSVLSVRETPTRLDEEVGESSRHQSSPMDISSSPIKSERQVDTTSSGKRTQNKEMGDARMMQGSPSGGRHADTGSDERDDRILQAASGRYNSSSSTSQERTGSAQRHKALPNHPARDRKRRLTSTAEHGRLQRTRSGEIERSSTRALPHRSVSLMNPPSNPSSKGKATSAGSGTSWATAIDITSSPPEAGPSGSQAYPRYREQEILVNRPSRADSAFSTGRSQVHDHRRPSAAGAMSSRTGENPLPSLPGEETRRRHHAEESSRTASMPWEAAASATMPRAPRQGRRVHSNSVRESTFDHNLLSGRPRGQSDAIRNPRRERRPGADWELSGTDERTLRAFLSGGSETQTLAEALSSPREGDLDSNLPRWQPDTEVTSCPICGTVFSFWYRKHHCRKCGRVVCASCSPHRITIPRQYIVRAPDASLTNASSPTPSRSVVDLTEDDDPVPLSPSANPALGGGEEVRLCNPCVPDPNPNPLGYSGRSRGHRSTHSLPSMGNQLSTQQVSYSPIDLTILSQLPCHYLLTQLRQQGIPWTNQQRQAYNALYEQGLSREARQRIRNSDYYLAGHPPAEVPPFVPDRTRPIKRNNPSTVEEDWCPICGRHFLDISPEDSLEVREAHIRECIDGFQVGGSRRAPDVPAPVAPSRVLEFKATEKDCIGITAECSICLEEYEEGDVLARLECLCKFHKHCIRDWFKHKTREECPVHKHS